MDVREVLATKRDGGALSKAQIDHFISGYVAGEIEDYHASALLMAIYVHGMQPRELVDWTHAMLHSGSVIDLSDLDRPTCDKHSTGGVGDKVSICLAPAVAACGVWVPMVSGRGLGHTGGTLDKLEAVPGLETRLTTERFIAVLAECGFVMGGQSGDIAPADKKLYSLRDVTSTVESLPLIASSIMSKKLAEGIGGLVLDVKVGSGAFMKTLEDARALARALVDIGGHVGVTTTAFLTDMDQPLGNAIGNANEMAEALEVMRGGGPADLVEITTLLGGEMCVLGSVAKDLDAGRAMITRALNDGSAMERMRLMVAAQGGDTRVCDEPDRLPRAPLAADVIARATGFVSRFETERLGRIVIALGGGRNVATDEVDPAVGIEVLRKRGAAVKPGDVLARVTAQTQDALDQAVSDVSQSIHIADEAPEARPLLIEVIR